MTTLTPALHMEDYSPDDNRVGSLSPQFFAIADASSLTCVHSCSRRSTRYDLMSLDHYTDTLMPVVLEFQENRRSGGAHGN